METPRAVCMMHACHLVRTLGKHCSHARAHAQELTLTHLSVWPRPMRRSGAKPQSSARSHRFSHSCRGTHCAQQLHRVHSLQSSCGLQLGRIAAAAAEKSLLADVTAKNPDASYIELLRLFKVRRSVADGHLDCAQLGGREGLCTGGRRGGGGGGGGFK